MFPLSHRHCEKHVAQLQACSTSQSGPPPEAVPRDDSHPTTSPANKTRARTTHGFVLRTFGIAPARAASPLHARRRIGLPDYRERSRVVIVTRRLEVTWTVFWLVPRLSVTVWKRPAKWFGAIRHLQPIGWTRIITRGGYSPAAMALARLRRGPRQSDSAVIHSGPRVAGAPSWVNKPFEINPEASDGNARTGTRSVPPRSSSP